MNRYWFKPKTYGYGATPVTWQGWALTIGGIALSIAATAFVVLPHQMRPLGWLLWLAAMAIIVGGSWIISKRKTEGAWRWRWGNRD